MDGTHKLHVRSNTSEKCGTRCKVFALLVLGLVFAMIVLSYTTVLPVTKLMVADPKHCELQPNLAVAIGVNGFCQIMLFGVLCIAYVGKDKWTVGLACVFEFASVITLVYSTVFVLEVVSVVYSPEHCALRLPQSVQPNTAKPAPSDLSYVYSNHVVTIDHAIERIPFSTSESTDFSTEIPDDLVPTSSIDVTTHDTDNTNQRSSVPSSHVYDAINLPTQIPQAVNSESPSRTPHSPQAVNSQSPSRTPHSPQAVNTQNPQSPRQSPQNIKDTTNHDSPAHNPHAMDTFNPSISKPQATRGSSSFFITTGEKKQNLTNLNALKPTTARPDPAPRCVTCNKLLVDFALAVVIIEWLVHVALVLVPVFLCIRMTCKDTNRQRSTSVQAGFKTKFQPVPRVEQTAVMDKV